MRIKVKGDCLAARVLRGYLENKGNCRVVDKVADYTVFLRQDADLDTVVIDSVDCELERFAINMMYEKGVPSFRLMRAGGVQSDNEIYVTYPQKYEEAVELGLYRALTHHDWKKEHKLLRGGARKAATAALFFTLVLLASLVHSAEPLPNGFVRTYPILFQPANFPIIRFWDGSTVQNASFTGSSLNINCTGGCGGAASFADASAFTFGTTSISNIGAVVDDVATNTVAENSAGNPRMNTNRILYFNPRTNAGVEIPFPAALGAGGGLKVDQATSPWVDNVSQFGGSNIVTGTGVGGAGIPRVTVSNDSNILATQSGTWNIGTVTTLTGITNALPAGTNRIGSVRVVDSADADQTSVKGTQTARFLGNQSVIDAGRNQTNYFMALPIVTTAAEVMQAMTGYKGGVGVAANVSPAVVTAGKTYRINQIIIEYVAVAAAGGCRVTLRANLGGAGVIGSPLVWEQEFGGGGAAGVVSNFSIPFPDGMEFPAGTGIAVGNQGFNAAQAAAIVGYCQVAIMGFEY